MVKSNKFVRLAVLAATLLMAALLAGCPDSGPSQKYSDEEVVKRLTTKLTLLNSDTITITPGEVSHSKGTVTIKNFAFNMTDQQGILTAFKAETITLKGFNHDYLDDETPKAKILLANSIVAQNYQLSMGLDAETIILQYNCENMNFDGLAFNPSLIEIAFNDFQKLADGDIAPEMFFKSYMNALKEISYDTYFEKNIKGHFTIPFEDTTHNFAIESNTSKNFKDLTIGSSTVSNITAESPFYNFSTESITFKNLSVGFLENFLEKMDTMTPDDALKIFYDAKIMPYFELKNMVLKVNGENAFSLKRFTSNSTYEPEYANKYAFEGVVLNKAILTSIEGMVGLAAFGMDSITFDHNSAFSLSKDMKTITLGNFTFDVKDLAVLDLAMKLKDITEKAPYSDPFEEFEIHKFVVNYEDKGLMPRILNLASMITFQDAETLLAEVLENLDVRNLPTDLEAKNALYAQSMIKDLATFIANPGKLTISLLPSKPITNYELERKDTSERLLSNKEITLSVKKGTSILESAQKIRATK